MKKIIILIPVFNDWESLNKLLTEIENTIKNFKNIEFNIIVINDASTMPRPKIEKLLNMNSIKIVNMKKNKGHARCIAFGLRYICKHNKFDYLILMDGDGEDRPKEIKSLIDKALQNPDKSIVAKRVKRSEGPFFQFLYQAHKLIAYIFTGKKINFGNYSCLTYEDSKFISSKSSLWSSFSGTLKKNINNLEEIDSTRGLRYFGPSKMSILNLILHSLSIIAVFKYNVFIRSFILLLVLWLMNFSIGLVSIIFQILIILFNFLIFLVSLRENNFELINSQENLSSEEEV